MKLNEDKLRTRGWSEEQINHTKQVILEAEKKKHPKLKLLEEIIEWIILTTIVLSSIAGAWLIEPLLFVLTEKGALIAIGISGIIFGSFASMIIKQIDKLETKHHLIISLTIPLSAIITSIVITKQTQSIIKLVDSGLNHNPYWLGIVYAICTLIPYGIFVYTQRNKDGSL